jgi:hypothetical protein
MSRASIQTITAEIGNDFGLKVQTFIEPAPYVNYATTLVLRLDNVAWFHGLASLARHP